VFVLDDVLTGAQLALQDNVYKNMSADGNTYRYEGANDVLKLVFSDQVRGLGARVFEIGTAVQFQPVMNTVSAL